MFGKSIKLFTLLGFTIKMDLSWLILALLVTWSLAKGLFPMYFRDLANATYWWMGVAGSLGLFVSIVLHELAHSVVARSYGIPLKGITLFIFGGVAEMNEEPRTAKSELLMAVAGPVMSLILGGVLLTAFAVAGGQLPGPVNGVIGYLGFINLLLAAFNMLPAFPLDGGRVLRSALWYWKDNLQWATRVASRVGAAFGIGFMILGGVRFLMGDLVGGVWMFLIGMFLRSVSHNAYQHLLVRNALEGEPVGRFMEPDPITVPAHITVRELVDDYIYRHRFTVFPVVDEARRLSCVNLDQVKGIPPEEWNRRRVIEVADSCSLETTIPVHEDAMQALTKMNRTGNQRLLVTDNGRLVGVLPLKNMLEFITLKLDLEQA